MTIRLRPARCLSRRALCADLHHGQVWGVVDVEGSLGQFAHSAGQPGPVLVTHTPGAHVGEGDFRFGGQHPHDDLGLRHFQREDDSG